MGIRPWAGMAEQCRVGLSALPLPPPLGPARAVRGRGTSPCRGVDTEQPLGFESKLEKKKGSDEESPRGII